jgi:Tol biopolymer transport system component
LAFSSTHTDERPLDLYRRAVGGEDEELLSNSNESKFARQWLKDGSLLFASRVPGTSYLTALYRLPLSGGRKPALLLKPESEKSSHATSNGRWVAYESDETGRWEVYVAAFPTFTEKRQVSSGGGCQALWRKDGKELFYLSLDGKLMSVEVRRGAGIETGAPRVLFAVLPRVDARLEQYCVTRDGQRFIFSDPIEEPSRSFTVVLNWIRAAAVTR